jgi:ERCC4-related helicase/HKD family nuclease
MSTKFFTNESEKTLISKIEGVFKHRQIHFFDALVGYFRASGYFRIRKFIEKTAEVRILVGINIDTLIFEASQQGLLFDGNEEKSQEDFFRQIKQNIQEAEYDKEVEEGMIQLIQDIASKRIKIKVHPKQNIHAKIYIFKEEVKHDHGYGAVITGSSNLTDAGLSKNFEFNVELRDNSDIDFASETFNKLWHESVEIGQQYIDKLKKETYLNDEFTPFQVYMKFLIEYFGKSIEFDPNSITDLPHGFKRLSYQADAVADGFSKMMKHGGFFLADVVGLGKTVVATLIAKKYFYSNGFPSYRSRTLIITPPAIKPNWEDTIYNFRLDNCKIITNGSLHKIAKPEDFDLIIVDEAHKFRTDTAEMYNQLQKICKSPTRKILPNGLREPKRVILISATPLNNRPEDIANLVYLFQDSKNSTLEVGNLQHFFRQQIDAYKKLKEEDNLIRIRSNVKFIYDRIRIKVIEPLTVRRTRTDLKENEAYKKDIAEQGIVFPPVNKPEKIFYLLDEELDAVYDKTIGYLKGKSTGLTYNRYRAISELKPHKKIKYKNADLISDQLAKIMKTLLVKRIDSSFFAFKSSLSRFSQATNAMVKMFEKGTIYIAPNLGVTEYINEDREEELIKLISEESATDPTIEVCNPDDFEPGFHSGLLHDKKLLDELVDAWKDIEQDPKVDVFIQYLKTKLFKPSVNKEGKLVVFSESKETTNYLKDKLVEAGFEKILCVESLTRHKLMPAIRENFDANIPLAEQKNDHNIIISTEVLAEGVNLHRANIIVNYDTPWNSTRLMQRIGRVNRIGSVADAIHIFNFFPTSKVDSDIDLQKKAVMKLEAFHAALGEDSQIYSPEEEPGTFGLYDKNIEEERDEKLVYLMKLRKFKEDSPEMFKLIKNMPLRARTGRKNKTLKNATLTFIRSERRDAFYFVREDNAIDELTFLEAVKVYEATADEKHLALHNLHHEQVKTAIDNFASKLLDEKVRDKKVDVTQGPNEKKALSYLDAFLNFHFISQKEREHVLAAKQAIRIGKYQNLQRDINKLSKATKTNPVKPVILLEKLVQILDKYPLRLEDEIILPFIAALKDFKPDIIITESFNV